MKRHIFAVLLGLVALFSLGLAPSASAQNATVSGDLSTIFHDQLQGDAFVRIRLRNYSGCVPRITGGGGIITETTKETYPDAAGHFSQILIRNDFILCGVTTGATYYTVEYWNNGISRSSNNYQCNAATCDLNTLVAIGNPPVVAAPTGDSTYARLDGGNTPFTGPVIAIAGKNSFNFYNHNNILWVGTTSPYRYSTLETGITAPECPAAGCNVNLVNGFAETFTAPITIGNNSTNRYFIEGYPNSSLTCNITGGTNCILLQRNTALAGQILGGLSAHAGLYLSYPATANFSNFITTNDGVTNFKGYVRVENLEIDGNASATVSNAVFDAAAVSNQSSFRNIFVSNFANTIGFLVRSVNQTNGVAGPLNIENVWTDPSYNAGAKPCVIQSQGNSIGNINWIGGTCNHPGSGQTMFLVDGGGVAGKLNGVNILGTYLENFSNGSSIAYKLVDTTAVHISGNNVGIQDTDTAVDISQTVLHGAAGIQVTAFRKTSATNAATTINNHVTGFTSTKAIVPFYNYGGDVGLSVMPFTVESNDFQILDGANHQAMLVPAQSTTGVQPTFFNAADAQGLFTWKCGLTATQICLSVVSDRGTAEWGWGADSSNNFIVSDRVNSKTRLSLSQSATPATTGNGLRLTNTDAVGNWRNNANGADIALAKTGAASGTTPADTLDASGFGEVKAAYVKSSNQTLQVISSNFTTSSTTLAAAGVITGLNFTAPASVASNWSFRCDLIYSQATAAAANLFGVTTAATAPTNLLVGGQVLTSNAGVQVDGSAVITTATSTTVVTATPSAFGAIGTGADMFVAHIWGTLEAPSNASPTQVGIAAATGNASDALTIYRGSACNWY